MIFSTEACTQWDGLIKVQNFVEMTRSHIWRGNIMNKREFIWKQPIATRLVSNPETSCHVWNRLLWSTMSTVTFWGHLRSLKGQLDPLFFSRANRCDLTPQCYDSSNPTLTGSLVLVTLVSAGDLVYQREVEVGLQIRSFFTAAGIKRLKKKN